GLGLVLARPAITASGENDDGAWTSSTENPWATPPHVDLAWASGKLVVGLAAGVPFGGGVVWPVDWQGRFEIVRSRLEVFRVAPFVGWSSGKVRVAGGVHVDRGRMRVARQLDFIDMEGDVAIDMAGTGVGAHLAAWTQASADVALGLTYKSRTKLPLAGGADFTVPDAFAGKTPDQEARATITLPDRFVLGSRYARGRWTALADLELTLWGAYRELAIDFAQEQTPDVHQPTRWHTPPASPTTRRPRPTTRSRRRRPTPTAPRSARARRSRRRARSRSTRSPSTCTSRRGRPPASRAWTRRSRAARSSWAWVCAGPRRSRLRA
ncbi:MAG: outer membrane protein transport protein, partial [Deltaproteobacteria bacterium]|nr:outer membrane protein transport protein [Kofleriaceae bacterium]